MLKKELNIKIDYLSIVFDTIKADELIRRLLGLPLDYFMIQKAKVKHKDYTNLYQFGTIKVYGDRKLKDGTSEAGCYLILSGQGCDDYYSLLQEGNKDTKETMMILLIYYLKAVAMVMNMVLLQDFN